jgi:hypothetical protein
MNRVSGATNLRVIRRMRVDLYSLPSTVGGVSEKLASILCRLPGMTRWSCAIGFGMIPLTPTRVHRRAPMFKGFAPMPEPEGIWRSLDRYVGVAFVAIGSAWMLVSGLYAVSLAPARGDLIGVLLVISTFSTFLGALVFALGFSKLNTDPAGNRRLLVPVAAMASGIVLLLLSAKDTIRNVSLWVEKGNSGPAISEGSLTLLGFFVFIAGRLLWKRNTGQNPSGPDEE